MGDIPTLPSAMFEHNWVGVASFVVAILLPVLAALLTKVNASSQVKGLVLLALAALKTFLDLFIASGGNGFDVVDAVWTVGLNFAIAVVAYFGLWRGGKAIAKASVSGVK